MSNTLSKLSKSKYFKIILKVLYSIFIFLQFINLLLLNILPIISILILSNFNFQEFSTHIDVGLTYNILLFSPSLIIAHVIKTLFSRVKSDLIILIILLGLLAIIFGGPVNYLIINQLLTVYIFDIFFSLVIIFYFYYFIYSIFDFRRYLKLSKVKNVTL